MAIRLTRSATRPDLITGLRFPIYISHRGGPLRFPEHSIEGYRASAADGFPVEGGDVNRLADGSLVCLHDSTIDRTMTGTGTVTALTRAQWEALRVKQSGGPGTTANWITAAGGRPTYFVDVLEEFGGRVLLFPEIKDPNISTSVITEVTRRNLHRAVVLSSFSWTVTQQIAASGVSAMFVSDTVGTGGANPSVADLTAAGVEWLACSTSASAAYIAAAKAAGLRVIVYTVNTRTQAGTSITTNGADGVYTDDPWYVSRRSDAQLASDSDPWATKRFWAGARASNATGVVFYGLDMMGSDASASAIHYVNHNWAGVRTSTGRIRIRVRVHFLPSSNTDLTRWVSLFAGQFGDDASYLDSSTPQTPAQYGYHLLIRRNGSMDIWTRNAAGVAAQLSTVAGTSIANTAEGSWDIEATIDATNVTLKNITQGTSTTVANTAYREAFKLASIINGTHAYLSRMSVTDLA